ncbi:hypothetical protein MAPG_09475 [Magnaporthiopsis poae ATCC 64411]|uniref:Uncharacterized protein n=1 Tax=Magnaporthiopsis poae (strain ATCC 64411 / 73-15) TaxID=644358 RepID=A0A0C4EA21_MAGP6|nr:hypothetical protein MAPG_09475 [Magnaporthiopsis poae ATCC 64411]
MKPDNVKLSSISSPIKEDTNPRFNLLLFYLGPYQLKPIRTIYLPASKSLTINMKVAVFFMALVASAIAAPSNPLEERKCLPSGALCDRHEDCCSNNCFLGKYPSDPVRCG